MDSSFRAHTSFSVRIGVLAGITGLAFLAAGGRASAATVDLDSHSTAGGRVIGPAALPIIPTGVRQIAQVQGTVSFWSSGAWASPRALYCGAPLTGAVFPSPGRAGGPTGVDAETRFGALVFKGRGVCTNHIGRSSTLEVSTGGAYADPTPLPSSDPATHTYRYALVGTGAPAQFRMFDPTSYDNYGVLRITTRDAVGSDCVGIGAAQLGYGSEVACRTALGDAPPADIPVVVTPAALPASGATPVAVPVGTAAVSPAKAAKPGDQPTVLPCRSSRAFTIRIKEPRARRLRSAKLYLNGKRIATARRRKSDGRLVARVSVLKNKRRGVFTIRIKAVRTNGKKLNGFRRYRTCTGKAPSDRVYFNKSLL
ncbi:hypothetical protein [Patulibacter minatonensis]|uniref:hypothetical protein n=1 Tax=Patulibacter minatonensis TaxID=298163 RepID=UPI00047B26E8|nr:hypothetical protein [Patulibacter minatonensis]